MPKVYAFDIRFVCHARSIDALRAAGMHSYAPLHPRAAFWLVAEDRQRWTVRRDGRLEVVECGPGHLPELMGRHRG
jgi:hypothetical protein